MIGGRARETAVGVALAVTAVGVQLASWSHVSGHRSLAPAAAIVFAASAFPVTVSAAACAAFAGVLTMLDDAETSRTIAWFVASASCWALSVAGRNRGRFAVVAAICAGVAFGLVFAMLSSDPPALRPMKAAAHAGFGALGAVLAIAIARRSPP